LNSALDSESEKQKETEVIEDIPMSKVKTTEEELEGYQIVLAILRKKLEKSRIVHRDTQSYFGILLDDNNRKPLCRLHLNGGAKYISLFDENKDEIKNPIESIDDIYRYDKELLKTVDYYEQE
jgi:hypothetical protein